MKRKPKAPPVPPDQTAPPTTDPEPTDLLFPEAAEWIDSESAAVLYALSRHVRIGLLRLIRKMEAAQQQEIKRLRAANQKLRLENQMAHEKLKRLLGSLQGSLSEFRNFPQTDREPPCDTDSKSKTR